MAARHRSYSADEFARLVEIETNDVELKTGLGRKPLQECLVAFTNTEGGTIFIGVTDDRRVSGRRRDQGSDDAIHEAAGDALNLGRYEISTADVNGVPIIVVDVERRADAVAQTSDGRALRRRGGRNVAMFGDELWEAMSSRALRRYENSDSGVPVTATAPTAVARVAEGFGWTNPPPPDRLRERGLLHANGTLTVAGALTLADPAVALGASKFHIDVRAYPDDTTQSYLRRDIVGGAVQEQVERAVELVLRDVGTEMVVTGAMRHDVPRLPRRVVREVVTNAVAHRDYARDTSPVVIEIRPSFVSVLSPGRLPPPVSVATLRESQSPRNHHVIDVLRRLGLAEDSGQGIDVIQDEMRTELLEEPRFVETPTSFAVTLPMQGLISVVERAWVAELERTGRTERDDRALVLLALRHQQVTNTIARDALGVDSTEARSRLQRLRDAGLLEQHGTRGRAFYTLGVLGPAFTNEEVVLRQASDEPITNERVRALTGLDRNGARSLLRRLVAEHRLVQHGSRRGTTYTVSET